MKYKLKTDARKFFEKKLGEKIECIEYWNKLIISKSLLDEVENVYIQYGIQNSKTSTSLCGWNGNKKQADFRFTIMVNEIGYEDYNDCDISSLMDKMQKTVNEFFKPLTK